MVSQLRRVEQLEQALNPSRQEFIGVYEDDTGVLWLPPWSRRVLGEDVQEHSGFYDGWDAPGSKVIDRAEFDRLCSLHQVVHVVYSHEWRAGETPPPSGYPKT